MKINNIPDLLQGVNVLIYDDKNIQYFSGISTAFEQNALINEYQFIDGTRHSDIYGWNIILKVPEINESENIKLDDTTMKRIAKFNKEQECIRLDEKIKEKKEKIKELDNLLKDKEKRWNKVKEYIANIYDLDLDEDDYDDEYDW